MAAPDRSLIAEHAIEYGSEYSTLEYVPHTNEHCVEYLTRDNAQHHQDRGLLAPEPIQAYAHYASTDYKGSRGGYFQPEKTWPTPSDDTPLTTATNTRHKILGIRKKTFIIVASAVGALALVGVVLGASLGTILGNQKATSSTATQTALAPASTSAAPYPTSTPVGYTGLRSTSGLAATAFKNPNDDAGWQYFAYYQDENNLIKESAYNSSTNTWTVNTLTYVTYGAKPGSSLAAASAMRGNTAQINVIYFDTNNMMHELWRNVDGTNNWMQGQTDQQTLIGHSDTKVVTSLDSFYGTWGLVTLWQGSNLTLEITNSTAESSGQNFTASLIDGLPPGAGLALSAYQFDNELPDYQLYYNDIHNTLTRISWSENNITISNNPTGQGWSTYSTQTLGPIPAMNASLASFAYGTTSPSQMPQSMQILNAGIASVGGLNATYWLGSDNGGKGKWEGSTTPDVFRTDLGPDTRVAATIARQVFAITRDGRILQYTVGGDGLSWTKVGLVPTK